MTSWSLRPARRARKAPAVWIPSCEFPARRITASWIFSGRRSARSGPGVALAAGESTVGALGSVVVSFTLRKQYQNCGVIPVGIARRHRGQKSEVRGQRSEVRGQRSETLTSILSLRERKSLGPALCSLLLSPISITPLLPASSALRASSSFARQRIRSDPDDNNAVVRRRAPDDGRGARKAVRKTPR